MNPRTMAGSELSQALLNQSLRVEVSAVGSEAGQAPVAGSEARSEALRRMLDLALEGADQQQLVVGLAREIAQLAHAGTVQVRVYRFDGTVRATGVWPAPLGEERTWDSTVELQCAAIGLRWGEVALADLDDSMGVHLRAVVSDLVTEVSPVVDGAYFSEELGYIRARSTGSTDLVRSEIAEQIRQGPRRRLVEASSQLAAAEQELSRNRAKALALIATAREGLAAGLEDFQRIARGIHPTLLGDRGLDVAVQGLADVAAIPVRTIGGVGRRLAYSVELATYRVVESVINSATDRHATSITVELGLDDDELRVEISDDAVGPGSLDRQELGELSERVVARGGRLTVTPASTPGSTISVRIPLSVDA